MVTQSSDAVQAPDSAADSFRDDSIVPRCQLFAAVRHVAIAVATAEVGTRARRHLPRKPSMDKNDTWEDDH
jgi:hypothetical protein